MKFEPYYEYILRRVGDSKRREAQNEETSLLSCHEDDGGKFWLGRMKLLSLKNLLFSLLLHAF